MGLIGVDNDVRLHQEIEFYRTGILNQKIIEVAKKWSQEKGGAIVIVDETAAELIAELKNAGLHVEGHKGKVLDGIAIVQGLLVPQGDGKPRYTCDPSCVNTINEWESYVWRPGKDEPVKENDHEMDLIRYVAHWLFAKEFTVEEVIYAPIRIGYG
jgi:phage terminase large subunit